MTSNAGLIVAALAATNSDLAGSQETQDAYKAELLEMGARVSLYRDYERGDHRAGITDQMRKMLRLPEDSSGIRDFNANYMRIVIDKMASRLHVTEISVPEGRWSKFLDKFLVVVEKISPTVAAGIRSISSQLSGEADSKMIDEWLTDTLERNDWEAMQGTTFRGAIRDGDSYILVDPNTLMWSIESAYDGFSGMVAIFDGIKKTPIWACKIWAESTQLSSDTASSSAMRLVVYQPNSVSHWTGQSGSNEVNPLPMFDITDTSPVKPDDPNERIISNTAPWPIGKTPIVHFVNQYDSFNSMGESELRPAIPLQDVLNRTLHSMVMASEFSAFRVKWSIGVEIDANGITPGAVINLVLKDGAGNIITDPTLETVEFLKAVRVGQFEETPMEQYTLQIDKIVREISQCTQTPIYGITVQGVLSGEAMKQLEVGLIGKVERFQRQNADSVRELIQLTAEIQNAFRNAVGTAPVFDSVSLTWKPAEILDTDAQITTLIKMRTDAPGLWDDDFYRSKIGSLLGMSQSEVETESENARITQQNTLDRLVGRGGQEV